MFEHIDSYCERLDASFWAEPVNFVTNAAFMLAALYVWPQVRGMIWGQVLAVILFVIGVGSALFHSFAQTWAAIADVVPILIYVLVYIALSHRVYWQHSRPKTALFLVLFVPYVALTLPLFQMVPGLGSSAAYAPIPLLIFIHAALLRRRLPQVARGLAIGASILCASILARVLDEPMCGIWPMGTHFMWHILNAAMLMHMILVYRAHMLAAGQAGR
ncbi:ceramidase domain-containing protein [Phaeobacter sp. CNT1-3]|nr:ceramidase domain-containing protein [Phaeobacter sp. CNT1-3]